jgi:ribose 5-phosphate isomerase A
MDAEALKRLCAEAAAREVVSGDIVGLGTGSTVYYTIRYLGQLVKDEGLGIVGIPTSKATEKVARDSGISLATFEEYQELDIAIDGADQVDKNLNLIKGGGGAHVREKIVARASRRFIVIADERKLTDKLNVPVPVEVLPFALGLVMDGVGKLGGTPILRLSGKDYFTTDNNNYVIDSDFGTIDDPERLESELNKISGVVDNGLFVGMTSEVFVGTSSGVKVLKL